MARFTEATAGDTEQNIKMSFAEKSAKGGFVNMNGIVLNSTNALLLQKAEFDHQPTEIHINAEGTGTALVTLTWTYHTKHTFDDSFKVRHDCRTNKQGLSMEIHIM